MPEADALIPGMAGAEYVALAGELYGMPRRQALRRAHEVLTYLDLEDARYRRLEEYSTGMKQRLKLAQALVHDPPALLLDEPTSSTARPSSCPPTCSATCRRCATRSSSSTRGRCCARAASAICAPAGRIATA